MTLTLQKYLPLPLAVLLSPVSFEAAVEFPTIIYNFGKRLSFFRYSSWSAFRF